VEPTITSLTNYSIEYLGIVIFYDSQLVKFAQISARNRYAPLSAKKVLFTNLEI